MGSLSFTSTVDAPVADVWARVSTFAGVNHELWPVIRMSPPRRHRSATIETIPVGVPLGRAIIWYLGFLPLDHDALAFAEVVPGSHFHEISTMGSMRHWEHRRTLEAVADGARTRVTDQLDFQPRLALGVRAAGLLVRWLFAHRHRRLAAHFASPE